MSITLGITAYQEGELLHKSIKSLLNQNLEDWIGYVVLDGGYDQKTLDVLNCYDDPRLNKIILSQNIGPYPARELIFEKSSNDVILHCDADDELTPNAASIVNKIFSDPSVEFAGFGAQIMEHNIKSYYISGQPIDLKHFILTRSFPGYVLFRKRMWLKYQGYNNALKRGKADFDFLLKLMANNEKYAYTDQQVITKYERSNSVSKKYKVNLAKKHEIIVNSNPKAFSNEILKNQFLKHGYMNSCWAAYDKGEYDLASEYARKYSELDNKLNVWPLYLTNSLPLKIIKTLVTVRRLLAKIKKYAISSRLL